MRAAGDSVSRLDRYETALNLVGPGEIHDTTTPAAMIGLLSALTLGEVLSPSSRRQLIAWMIAGKTGAALLRAGLPQRSEEHTSELQSLMRTSYAVFCLKKKHIT